MTIEDISEFLSAKAKEIKTKSGDAEHKKRTGAAKILPAP
jgi:hypothetical protein